MRDGGICRFRLTSLGARLGIDRAVFYALITRGWRIIAGLITVLLIAHYLTPERQGYYFTFQSLIALQAFLELGLGVVVVNVVSHEWAHLRLDASGKITGNPAAISRLVSLAHKLAVWYAIASAIFVLFVGVGGVFFLLGQQAQQVWFLPWLTTVILQGVLLWLMPFQALLEGCNQMAHVQRFLLWQALMGNCVLWAVLSAGGQLWSLPALLAVQVAATTYFLAVRYQSFFEPFWSRPKEAHLNWRSEVWPMQWRLGIQGIVSYFMYSIYVPVIFHYHGATEAGRFGMTWQLFGVLQTFALAWIQMRVPAFGVLVAKRKFDDLQRLWWKTTVTSLGAIGAGILGFMVVDAFLVHYQYALVQRFLPINDIVLLLPLGLMTVWVQSSAAFWRSYKVEPIGISGIFPGLVNGFLAWILGSRYGATGAIAAYLAVLFFISIPLSFYLKRQVTIRAQSQASARP